MFFETLWLLYVVFLCSILSVSYLTNYSCWYARDDKVCHYLPKKCPYEVKGLISVYRTCIPVNMLADDTLIKFFGGRIHDIESFSILSNCLIMTIYIIYVYLKKLCSTFK